MEFGGDPYTPFDPRSAFRAQSSPLMHQEVWGDLCWHYAIRTLRLDTTNLDGIEPDRVRSLQHFGFHEGHCPTALSRMTMDEPLGVNGSQELLHRMKLVHRLCITLAWSNARSSRGLPNAPAVDIIGRLLILRYSSSSDTN